MIKDYGEEKESHAYHPDHHWDYHRSDDHPWIHRTTVQGAECNQSRNRQCTGTNRDFAPIERARKRKASDDAPSDSTDDPVEFDSQQEDLQRMVFMVREDMTIEAMPVSTGLADDRFIEIQSGIEGGTRVVNGPYSAVSRELSDGDVVEERESREI